MLDQPMDAEPGTKFVYNTGVSVLLSGVIQHVTGQSAEAFAGEVLFGPLGIHEWQWYTSPLGVTDTGGGLLLRPRDMAKLGFLYLREGVWEPTGERLLPATWVQASTRPYTHDGAGGGYGYQWWIQRLAASGEEMQFPYAVGWGGQRIYVIPPLDLVVAMTAEGYEGETIRRGTILLDYIFPSAEPEST
jgi:CubicO group peptidase (beta-lactamase class C family)